MKHVSASYSVILRLQYPDAPGFLGRIASAIGDAGGSIGSVDVVSLERGLMTRA
jgi:malate dehydrogenase (oxaloacetate-decarboxylating)